MTITRVRKPVATVVDTTNTDDSTLVTVEGEAPVEEKVSLELGVHNRYVLQTPKGGVLYEKGTVYEFSKEQAAFMLKRKSDTGIPFFKHYVPRAKRRVNTDGMPTQDMTTADMPDFYGRNPQSKKEAPLSPRRQRAVDVSEGEDLGLDTADDEGVEV